MIETPQIVAQRPEQIDDRHAQRGVDHRDRLVGDDQRGLRDQRAGDRDPLQLAAGQLVREAAAAPRRARARPCAAPRRRRPRPRRVVLRVREAARGHEQVAVDALQRIEGLERVLEDRLDLAHEGAGARSAPRDGRQVGAAKADRARRRRHEVRGSCARAWSCRCPNSPTMVKISGRAAVEREADVVDRIEGAAARRGRPSR